MSEKKPRSDRPDKWSNVAQQSFDRPGGLHQESKSKKNKRTGRLKGAEKRKVMSGDYD